MIKYTMSFNLSLLLRINQIQQFLLHKVNVFLSCKFRDKFPDILAADVPNNRKGTFRDQVIWAPFNM